ncbi:cellulose binding domain-containing protein [Symbioplanes lichenis]|uniref:cellulose binding domain-containing protein n=1 Tax=Symbioplanes lichenis TaxID=1629072 RepID=UPI0027390D58|nr:cellulose binding domain-containing protein [Actinoplanes lichenis]
MLHTVVAALVFAPAALASVPVAGIAAPASAVAATASVAAAPASVAAVPAEYACQVEYEMFRNSGGFQSNITITNTGEATIKTWTLYFVLPAGQRLVEGWNADWTTKDQALTAVSLDYNSEVVKGAQAFPQFRGTGTDSSTEPAEFFINGVRCSVR